MKELKTLKDLRYFASASGMMILETKLKAEAVKWVKLLQPELSKLNNIELLKRQKVSDWIINFFNLTEEDFKGGK